MRRGEGKLKREGKSKKRTKGRLIKEREGEKERRDRKRKKKREGQKEGRNKVREIDKAKRLRHLMQNNDDKRLNETISLNRKKEKEIRKYCGMKKIKEKRKG